MIGVEEIFLVEVMVGKVGGMFGLEVGLESLVERVEGRLNSVVVKM